jgi:hypothetical protein
MPCSSSIRRAPIGRHRITAARRDRDLRACQRVTWIAILRQGVGNEAIVGGIVHRGVEEAIDEEGAGNLVQFVLYLSLLKTPKTRRKV